MNTIVLFSRVPGCAPMKTRLLDALGATGDVELARALLLDTVEIVRQVRARLVVAFEPAGAYDELAALIPGYRLLPQRGDDLGARMAAAIDDLLAAGAKRVVLVGSDVPALEVSHVTAAFAALTERPDSVVLVPTGDGGYGVVGMARPRYGIFTDVPWGTADVYRLTLVRAQALRIPVMELPPTDDIDTVEGLQRLLARDPRAAPAPRTRAWARRHLVRDQQG